MIFDNSFHLITMASIATTEENNTNWVENHGYEGVNFDMGQLVGVWKVVNDNLYLEIFEETKIMTTNSNQKLSLPFNIFNYYKPS